MTLGFMPRTRDSLGRFLPKARTEPYPVKTPSSEFETWSGGEVADDPSCWIDRNGDVYFVHENGGSHSSTCRRITDSGDGMYMLEQKGWLHVSYTNIYTGYDSAHSREVLPTQAQIDAIFDLAMAASKVCERTGGRNYVAERFLAWCNKQGEHA